MQRFLAWDEKRPSLSDGPSRHPEDPALLRALYYLSYAFGGPGGPATFNPPSSIELRDQPGRARSVEQIQSTATERARTSTRRS